MQVSELIVETALKTSSKRKRKGLPKAIASQAGTNNPQVIVQNLKPEYAEETSVF